MTKEEFLKECIDYVAQWMQYRDAEDLQHIFNKFFESNVCIPKGKNRHPYADVLHEWIEGAEVLRKMGYDGWVSLRSPKWWFDHDEYRIKPQEPVYEWQWLHFSKTSNEVCGFTLDYFTEDEVDNDGYRVYNWVKIEDTKRVRQ